MRIVILFLLVTAIFDQSTSAQIAAGGTYSVEQSVVANGGGDSTSAQYSITGTAGQHSAGTLSATGPYSIRGGFWQALFVPTAALVSIRGRVLLADGTPLRNIRVTLAGVGGITRVATSNQFGNYRFDEVEAGQTYIISASGKASQFVPRSVEVDDELTGIDLIALD